ncbi:trypsin-like peptidase domain-containing protein, partial [Streptomyces goshikiensis]
MAELVRICDLAGRPRGSGFVADDRGTVLTSHEAVDGLTRVVLHGPGERIWLAEAEDVTPLPGLALALVRTDGLGLAPLPVAMRDVIVPGTYVRISARGWRQARVLSADAEATYTATDRFHVLPAVVELAIGTDGRDALRLGGEACGGPVLDAGTGAVLAVLGTALLAERRSGGLAVPLRAAAAADPRAALAALLERNEASAPGYGEDLNLAGALKPTGTTVGAALTPELPEPVPRPGIAAELAAFTAGDRHVLGLVGDPGTGRTTALAALASARARGPHPAPTLWLRGAGLRAADTSLADAAPAPPPMPRRGRGRHGGRTAPRPAQPDTDARVAGRAASGGARLLR